MSESLGLVSEPIDLVNFTEERIRRFWSKIRIGKENECWNWNARLSLDGYGKIKIHYRTLRSHRVAFFLKTGKSPKGMLVCHKCDNPICCNPDHLWLGTPFDNTLDMIQKGRKRIGSRLNCCKGTQQKQAKLTEDLVFFARTVWKAGILHQREMAKALFVSQSTLGPALLGKKWKHVKMP